MVRKVAEYFIEQEQFDKAVDLYIRSNRVSMVGYCIYICVCTYMYTMYMYMHIIYVGFEIAQGIF